LTKQGLLRFVPHLCENGESDAEIIHPYGIEESFEEGRIETAEYAIGQAAHDAAQAMVFESDLRKAEDCWLAPVPTTDYPNVQMVGIARLTYRPHTVKTRAWWAAHTDKAPLWAKSYVELKEKVEEQQTTRDLLGPTAYAL
jgi:hypothetical protein